MNRFISWVNDKKHALTEPLLLKASRRRFESTCGHLSRNPLVSIIIATYNRGEILVDRTLPSIFGQTYPNFEIIVVGDHCIDNTKELLAEVSDPRLRFYDLPKRGSYPKDPRTRWFVQGVVPRNRGLELAKGEWLCWISDDDMLLPNHFESLLGFAQKGNYEFVSAVYTYERNGGVFVQDVNNVKPRIGGMQTWMYRSYLRFYKWNLHSWRKEWNRPCDYDLQLRMYRDGVRMGFLEEIVAHVPAVAGTGTVGFEAQKTIG